MERRRTVARKTVPIAAARRLRATIKTKQAQLGRLIDELNKARALLSSKARRRRRT